MFDGALGFTCPSFQTAEYAKHECIVGVHVVGATRIRDRLGIADDHREARSEYYASRTMGAQRIAMRIGTIQFNGARGRPLGFLKGVLPIRRQPIHDGSPLTECK